MSEINNCTFNELMIITINAEVSIWKADVACDEFLFANYFHSCAIYVFIVLRFPSNSEFEDNNSVNIFANEADVVVLAEYDGIGLVLFKLL